MPDERDLKVKDPFPLRLSKRSFFVLGFLLTSWIRTNTSCIQRTTFFSIVSLVTRFVLDKKKLMKTTSGGGEGVLLLPSPSGRRQPAARYQDLTREIALSLTLWRQKPVSPARAHRGVVWAKKKTMDGLPAFLSVSCPSTALSKEETCT